MRQVCLLFLFSQVLFGQIRNPWWWSGQTVSGVGGSLNFSPVDVLVTANGTSTGTAVTTANLATGTEIAANYNGWDAASASMTFATSQCALPGGITVNGGSTHTYPFATQALAFNATGTFTVSTFDLENKTPTEIVVGTCIVNIPPNQAGSGGLFDVLQTVGNVPHTATTQIVSGTNQTQTNCNSFGIEIENSGGTTTHSSCNNSISPSGTYVLELHVIYSSGKNCNAGTSVASPCAELGVWTVSGQAFTQVGSYVQVALGGTDTTGTVSFGNNEGGSFSGTMYFQWVFADYTNHVFPNIPH